MQTHDTPEIAEQLPEIARYQWPNKQFEGKRSLRSSPAAPHLVGPRMKGSIPAIMRKLLAVGKPIPFSEAGFDILKASDEDIEDETKFPRQITYNFGPFRTGYGGMKLFRQRYRNYQANATV